MSHALPESDIERLKNEISLQRLVEAQGIELTRHGADLLGRCPFHDDRTPSLVVSPKKPKKMGGTAPSGSSLGIRGTPDEHPRLILNPFI